MKTNKKAGSAHGLKQVTLRPVNYPPEAVRQVTDQLKDELPRRSIVTKNVYKIRKYGIMCR